MPERPPTSVLLPTVRPTQVVDELVGQLRDGDELLIVCDDEDDPVAREGVHNDEDGVRIVVAGDPDGCSGKANAVAAGMEAATNDRIVWTDDDFHHPEDWLDTLALEYERHGPVTEVPFFEGRDPLSTLLEPMYSFVAPMGIYAGDDAWGGALVFEREDLDVDLFLADLQRTVSDDGVLSEHLDLTAVKRVRRVGVGGTVRETLERHVRFVQISRHHGPLGAVSMIGVTAALTGASVLFPLYAAVLWTLAVGGVYAAFGITRWTVALAYPSFLGQLPLLVYALGRRTFVWGGRRLRWQSMYDVEVVDA